MTWTSAIEYYHIDRNKFSIECQMSHDCLEQVCLLLTIGQQSLYHNSQLDTKLNSITTSHMFFPASGSFWLFLLRAPFSLICYFPNLWLDVLITLVLFLRHSIEMPSWHNYKNTFEMWLPITALLQILNCHISQSQQHCHISYVLSHTLSQQLIKPALKLAWKKTTRNDKNIAWQI